MEEVLHIWGGEEGGLGNARAKEEEEKRIIIVFYGLLAVDSRCK